MATFLFLHGAWHGGWVWQDVVEELKRHGHRCHAPDLESTGPRIGLRDHVEHAERELLSLAPAVVVAHSYSGVVVRQLQSRRSSEIAGVVHVESLLPENGQSFLDLVDAETRVDYLTRARWVGGQWVVPAPTDVARWGITDPRLAESVRARLRPHPMRTFVDRVAITDPAVTCPQTYVYANDRESSPFQVFIDRCRDSGDWKVVGISGGHDMMLTNPTGLVAVLKEAAADVAR